MNKDVETCNEAILSGSKESDLQDVAGNRINDWMSADQDGLPEAQWLLGMCYEYGIEVEKDKVVAFKKYRSAVKKRNHKSTPNFQRAFAQHSLARCYAQSIGVNKDYKKAVELFTKAANSEYAPSQVNLATCYDRGLGVEKDEREAVNLYTKAAEQEYPPAQCT